jgi:hypothetical protein
MPTLARGHHIDDDTPDCDDADDASAPGSVPHRTKVKREKDMLRYLVLCANNPTAFQHAIDGAPESTIRRICDAVLNATNGDVRRKLTPADRRLCDKYKRSIAILLAPKKSLKTKRRLLRSAKKQVGGFVFVPLMLNAALDTLGSSLIPFAQQQ